MVTFEEIKNNEDLRTYIKLADESLVALGYTEHSFAHVGKVSNTAGNILETLGKDEHTVELAKIAGFMHDIGNLINRVDHSQSGAMMAFRLLDHLNMPAQDIGIIVTAIGNHDEGTGVAVNDVAAALIIADKCDVRRSRVRNQDLATFDIHDRVNYSVTNSEIVVNTEDKELILKLEIDTGISPVMDYFEIFLTRMIMCRKACEKLGLVFRLKINNQLMV